MILRARALLPCSQPPIEDGALRLEGDRITAVGRWADLRDESGGEVTDLGDVIVIPGLINAHCHLDYTRMAGLLPPMRSFSDWIKSIVSLKTTWADDEFAASWQQGAQMLVRSGTTTVIDSEAVPALVPAVVTTTPLNVCSCHEMISIRRQPADLLAEAVARVDSWPNQQKGLSPHAPYTTSAGLLSESAREAARRGWLLTTHVAESAEEFDMFSAGRGAMYDWLSPQRDMRDCGRQTPVAHVAATGALERMVVAHANYVTDEDIQLLAGARTHVVHCPRSHDYFGHEPFAYNRLRAAAINICLGTDSLATVRRHDPDGFELSLFAEMRTFLRHTTGVHPREALHMTTLNPARALGRAGELGELSAGARADLAAVPWIPGEDLENAVLQHRGPVHAGMIRGCWTTRPAI